MYYFINDATVTTPRIEIDITIRKTSLSDNDYIIRDFECAFKISKYFNFDETFMTIFGAEYSRILAWNSSKLKDVAECHESSFYDAITHALSITGQNNYFNLAQDIFHDVILSWKNIGSFKEPKERRISKPLDIEVYEFRNGIKNTIWEHSYR